MKNLEKVRVSVLWNWQPSSADIQPSHKCFIPFSDFFCLCFSLCLLCFCGPLPSSTYIFSLKANASFPSITLDAEQAWQASTQTGSELPLPIKINSGLLSFMWHMYKHKFKKHCLLEKQESLANSGSLVLHEEVITIKTSCKKKVSWVNWLLYPWGQSQDGKSAFFKRQPGA